MRIRLFFATGALLVASANLARAQQTPTTPPAADEDLTGTVDVGARITSTTGDDARYERYRDLRSGFASTIGFGKKTDRVMWDVTAVNVGYRDQKYTGDYTNGRAIVFGLFDSIPLNYSYLTSTPWVQTSTGVFTLDDAAQTAVQNKVPGVVGVPQTVANLSTTSIYRTLAQPFDLQSRRDTTGAGLLYRLSPDLGVNISFSSAKKSGNQPYGMSFSFNNANELPMPIDNRTNDMSAGLEYANTTGMIRVGWDASWFNNNIKSIVWDNPLRITDTTPFDASGYSNGNGPARGQMAVPPSNTMNTVSLTGLYKLPSHTTINGTVSFNAMSQNDPLLPWTTNAAIANPTVYKTYPGLAALPRDSAEASVHGVNALFNFATRPTSFFGLTMRYRFNDHKNLTPEFDGTQYVRFDAAPENTGNSTEPFNILDNTFDMAGTFNIAKYTALKIGYTFDDVNRSGRSFSDTRDYTLRSSLDTVGNQYLMMRLIYEHGTRIGSGFDEMSLEDGGLQPGLRFYDEADRDRNKGTLLFVLTPVSMLDATFSVAAAKDIYNGPGHDFGLLNNTNTSYNAGINLTPQKQVGFGVNYGYEKFNSLQSSANANPIGSDYGSWTDPNRVWNLTNGEKVNNFDLYLDLKKAIEHTDIHVSYDYSDSDNGFTFGGPRITELANNVALTPGDTKPCAAGVTSCFIPLPNVTNKWQRFAVDLKFYFTKKVGFGLGYWYEKFDVSDFATMDLPGQPGVPRIDNLGEISTGYGNRPYTGSTGFIRLLYTF